VSVAMHTRTARGKGRKAKKLSELQAKAQEE
jgi:AhpD family alkylhydroperoxidase